MKMKEDVFMKYVRLVNKPDLKKVLKDHNCVHSFNNIENQLFKRMNTCDTNGIFTFTTVFYRHLGKDKRPLVYLYFQIREEHLNGRNIIPFHGDIIDVIFLAYKTL